MSTQTTEKRYALPERGVTVIAIEWPELPDDGKSYKLTEISHITDCDMVYETQSDFTFLRAKIKSVTGEEMISFHTPFGWTPWLPSHNDDNRPEVGDEFFSLLPYDQLDKCLMAVHPKLTLTHGIALLHNQQPVF